MSIEAGARAGMIGPDDTTMSWLKGRPRSPKGKAWDQAVEHWTSLASDRSAEYDRSVTIDGSAIEPMVTFGTNPGMVMPVAEEIPASGDSGFKKALDYMQLTPGKPLTESPVDVVFIGSCTNSRISDLEQAAKILDGRQVAEDVRMLIVPGSQQIKMQAEEKGLDKIFLASGAEWRESGCSMCLAMNGDTVPSGQLSVSTSNRNFEGRQGRGGRTHLLSPAMAAAAAIAGHLADVRKYQN